MKFKYIILLLAILQTGLTGLQAQTTLSPSVQATQGGQATGSNVDLQWNMGETFIPTLTAGSTILSQGFEQPEIEIVTGAITGGPFCLAQPITVPFTTDGYVDASNVYTAQLSDASGSFASPIAIGTLTSTAISGSISATLPSAIAWGTGYLVRVISSAPVFNGKATSSAISIGLCSNTWIGTTTDWTNPANWSAGVSPSSCGDNVIIPANANNYPVLTGNATAGGVTIANGADINLQNYNLSICGNWAGPGSGVATVTGTGLVILNGSSAQTISGQTVVQEMMLNNPAGVTMQGYSSLAIYTALDLKAGTFNANGGSVFFKSTSVSSVAIIDNFSAGYTGTITGNITAERYFTTPSANSYGQHLLGTPVSGLDLSVFGAHGAGAFVIPQSDCDETRLAFGSPYGNVFSYHEANGAACEEAQWRVEGQGPAQIGVGYSVVLNGTGTFSVNGPTNLSDVSVGNCTNSGWNNTSLQNRPYDGGWQFLSNPYLATLQIDASLNSGSFDNQVQVWNTSTGSYTLTTTVAPFQGFMVHKTAVGGTAATYVIKASERVRNPQTFYQLNANQLTLVALNNATGLTDQTVIGFNPNATDTFDARFDANKLPGDLDRHTIYSVNNGQWMALNMLHDQATTSTVPVGFEPGTTGAFTLNLNGVNTFDPTSYIYLEDQALGVMHNARNGDYSFTADSADAWGRFVVHFTPPAQITTLDATCTSAGTINIQQPGTADWIYTLTDSSNAIVTSGILNQGNAVTVDVAPGTYLLTLTDTNNYVAVKSIQVNGSQMLSAAFNVSRDTVQIQQSVVLTATANGATNYQWNLGNGIVVNGATVTVSYAQAGSYNLTLLVTSAGGCTSTQTQTIIVLPASTTGLSNLTANSKIGIWSHDNKVYVDFTALQKVDATVIIYDILGQQISSEKVTNSLLYQKELDQIEAAYFVVMVKNDDKITTKKVFIMNYK